MKGVNDDDDRWMHVNNRLFSVAFYSLVQVLMSSTLSPVMQEEVRILLLRASEELPQGQDVFRMFGTFKGSPDLIFKVGDAEFLSLSLSLHYLIANLKIWFRSVAPI